MPVHVGHAPRPFRIAAAGAAAMALAACARSRAEPEPAPAPLAAAVTPGADPAGAGAADGGAPGATTPAEPGAVVAAPAGGRRAVFSLADNRLLAHLQVAGGLRVAAGSGGVAKYLGLSLDPPTWALGGTRDGIRVALPRGVGVLHVPLTAAQAAAATSIEVRLHAPAAGGSLAVRVNGAAVGRTAPLAPGWQVARLEVAAGRLGPGENVVELRFARAGAAVDWIQIGGAASPGTPTPAFAPPGTLLLPRDGGLVYHVHVPAAARLEAAVGGAGCVVRVTAADASGRSISGTLAGAAASLDLAALGGQVARLELVAAGCDEARLEEAALTVPGPAPAPAGGGRPPRFVVLWVMDALRADRVRLSTPGARAETPNLERLARRGAVFTEAYTQGNESQAGHASIWTATYPARHGIAQRDGARLPAGAPLLGRAMGEAGLRVLGVTANGFVTSGTGYDRGFDAFINLMRGPEARQTGGRVPAPRIYERALRLLAGHEREPWFLFLGTIDSHMPWIGYEPWLSRYDPGPYGGKFVRQVTAPMVGMIHVVRGCVDVPAPRDRQRILAIYDSDISYQDQWVGTLLDQLEAWGIADETMIVVTADHGEELWEHGRCGHGSSLRELQLRVPLVVFYPPLVPPATVADGAETMDVLPTILDALDRPIPDELQGESLLPLARGAGRGYPRAMVSTTLMRGGVAMRIDRWKLRLTRKRLLLSDVVADPFEHQELAPTSRPLEYRFVADPMALFLAHQGRWSKRRWGVASNMRPEAPVDLGW